MNIHLPAILMFTRYQGFDPSPYRPAKNGWFRWFRTRESRFANPALKWFGFFGLGGFHVDFLVGSWADHLYFLQKQNSNLSVSSLKDSLSLGAESSPPDPSTFALPSHAPVTTCQTWREPQESTKMSQKIRIEVKGLHWLHRSKICKSIR